MAPPWQDLELSWADVRVDTSLRPLLLRIISRPVDLTLSWDRRFVVPRQFVWVVRPTHDADKPRPSDAQQPFVLPVFQFLALFKRRGFFGRLRPVFVEWYNVGRIVARGSSSSSSGITYQRTVTTGPYPGTGDQVRFQTMWPFYGCVSVPEVLNGKCGNCLWSGKECSWESVNEGYPAYSLKAGITTLTACPLSSCLSGEILHFDLEAVIR
ncbi:hypothetical protein BT67DRAFT_436404 [Trichocladium antarcticum]|uniref:Uncharacterized protein n=1 Tax=Trichocladium antarcticum TaxID=1450529 RepID=A0AAN6ZAV7_9PEZI|nr:hypothetical protein BT67DRAFT_436404 [Trichocladium antarcticum]